MAFTFIPRSIRSHTHDETFDRSRDISSQIHNDKINHDNIHIVLRNINGTGEEGTADSLQLAVCILICLFPFKPTELVVGANRRNDIIWAMHVHLQVNAIQFTWVCFPDSRITIVRHTMVFCSIADAEIKIGLAQPNRYDIFHATVDGLRNSSISHRI